MAEEDKEPMTKQPPPLVPSIRLRSKRKRPVIPAQDLDLWDKIREEDSRFDQSQYQGGRKKFYQDDNSPLK